MTEAIQTRFSRLMSQGSARTLPIVMAMDRQFTAGDLSGMLANVRQLEGFRFGTPLMFEAYSVLCSLAFMQKAWAPLTEYALKTFSLGTAEADDHASACVLEAGRAYRTMSDSTMHAVHGHFSRFLENQGNRVKIANLPVIQKANWFTAIHYILPSRLFKFRLELGESLFKAAENARQKAAIAATCVAIASWAKIGQNLDIPPERVREKAGFILDSHPQSLASTNDDDFRHFVMQLRTFDLFDLIERTLALRNPAADDPIRLYVDISKKMKEAPEVAYTLSRAITPEFVSCMEPMTAAGFNRLMLLTEINYFSTVTQSPAEFGRDFSIENDFAGTVLLSAKSVYPQIVTAIESLQKRLFRAVEKTFVNDAMLRLPEKTTAAFGGPQLDAAYYHLPNAPVIDLFFYNPESRRTIRMSYHTHSLSGRPSDFSGKPVFAGMSPQESAKAAIIWDYWAVVILSTCSAFSAEEKAAFNKAIGEIDALINKEARALFNQRNLAALNEFREDFNAQTRFQNDQLALQNRSRISRAIVEAFIEKVSTVTYALSAADCLYPLVTEAKILTALNFNKACDDVFSAELLPSTPATPFPAGIIFKLRSGKELWAVIRSYGNVEILGDGVEANSLLGRYLTELVLEAMARLFAPSSDPNRDTTQAGILVTEDASSAAGKLNLKCLYKRGFRAIAKQKGLIIFPWFTRKQVKRDEYLYYPLEDQTAAGKKKALAEFGTANIYVQAEALGDARRLSLSPKKVNGHIEFSEERRNPLRVEQQEIFGDTQPLPQLYAMYVFTTFSDGSMHAYLHEMRDSMAAVLDDAYTASIESEIANGAFRDPALLFKKTKNKGDLLEKLISGEVTITEQRAVPYELNTTFRRPELTPLSQLMEEGLPLEVKGGGNK